MSQHPIDDLFSSQLRDHGVKPERASWEELQRRMNEKEERQSPLVWWYASAASVALLLLVSWWLWSGNETEKPGLGTNRIAQRIPEKTVLANTKSAERKPNDRKSIEKTEKPVIAFEKTAQSGKEIKTIREHQPVKTAPETVQEPAIRTKPDAPVVLEDMQKSQTIVAEVVPKEPERTLVVKIATPEIKSTTLVAAAEPVTSEWNEPEEEQPKRKRFRLGRVLRQINKLKAGEPVEWNEVGVQPGALLARASEKVHEGKEKLVDSYENLRYNAFKKNTNNK